ncbi:MAG TPA: hypothetical protein PLW93_06445 [Candidatus Absconditabacterales bacterium]|nr:hypothetical protein [Candidatus Absconditabacterales bacterium]HNG97889.1 hypothetical protein [Candidatus Absconditabacterales bacterium]
MTQKVVNIATIAQEQYVPSSLERKRSCLMYFLIGLIAMSGKSGLTEFEQFHFKQAMGFWLVVILCFLPAILLRAIPKIRIIFLPICLLLLIYLIIFINQCLIGKWMQGDILSKKMFYGLGNWMSSLFEG